MAIVRLTTCNIDFEANMLKNLLENEGIESFLTNENYTNLYPGQTGRAGIGIEIMIDDKDAEKAIKIVAGQTRATEIVCPNCNSKDVSFVMGRKNIKKILSIIISFLLFIPVINTNNKYICKHCGNEFKT